MLTELNGKVQTYRSITKYSVQFELLGANRVIEMVVSEPWVINRGDFVRVVGEVDPVSGKFVGYAYRNVTKSVFGALDASGYFGYSFGAAFIIGSILFAWAIFPLFTHLPAGIRSIKDTSRAKKFHQKVNNAKSMLISEA